MSVQLDAHWSDRIGGVRAALSDLDLTNPADAFVYGLAMGQAMEREQSDIVDDLVHRRAVAEARTHIDTADRRAKGDVPGPRAGDHHGGRVSSWGPITAPSYDGAYSR